MTYLTAPDAQESKTSFRCFAEVASLELDYEGLSMHYQVIDLVLAEEPTAVTVKALIATAGWLDGWSLVRFWEPQPDSDEDAPF